MGNQRKEMTTITAEEFEKDFDNFIDRVEAGESFYIKSQTGDVVMIPYNGDGNVDEIVKMYTDHNEAP